MIDISTSTLGVRWSIAIQRFSTGERLLSMSIGTPRRKQACLFSVEQIDAVILTLQQKRDELDAMCGPVP